jgi:sarcosine oxidase subunit beta
LTERDSRVEVVEAESAVATGSTGRSFASVRAQWADETNARIAWQSIQQYRDSTEEVGYRASGYLFLVPDDAWDKQLEAVALQQRLGIPVDVLTPAEAQRLTRFSVNGLGGCTWGPADGVVDPHLVTTSALARARRRGAGLHLSSPVTAVRQVGEAWRVRAGDRTFDAGLIVNAAGGWSGEVAALAGLAVPVHHVRRIVFGSAEDPSLAGIPMTIDVGTGVYLRSDGPRLLFGCSDKNELPGYRTSVSWDWLEPTLEAGCTRFPWLADLPLDRAVAWAGTSDTSPDHQAILGRMPEAPSWLNACGFSGHGVMQAPAVGRLIAEEALDGRAHSIDMDPLRITRLSDETRPLELVF